MIWEKEDVPYAVQLRRIYDAMTHCWKCGASVEWNVPVCESCGNELVEHGKN